MEEDGQDTHIKQREARGGEGDEHPTTSERAQMASRGLGL